MTVLIVHTFMDITVWFHSVYHDNGYHLLMDCLDRFNPSAFPNAWIHYLDRMCAENAKTYDGPHF